VAPRRKLPDHIGYGAADRHKASATFYPFVDCLIDGTRGVEVVRKLKRGNRCDIGMVEGCQLVYRGSLFIPPL
jgi:hypothetical protein